MSSKYQKREVQCVWNAALEARLSRSEIREEAEQVTRSLGGYLGSLDFILRGREETQSDLHFEKIALLWLLLENRLWEN